LQCGRQFRAGPLEFGAMREGKRPQSGAASRREPDPDFAFIIGARTPRDRSRALQPVYQLDGAVMLEEKARCDLANGRLDILRKALHGEQELVLLRLDAMLLRGVFAEMEKSPDLAAEFGELAVLLAAEILGCPHIYIVLRYNCWRRDSRIRFPLKSRAQRAPRQGAVGAGKEKGTAPWRPRLSNDA
jgi:hypothetical protein